MEDDVVTRLARTLDLKMTDVEAAEAGRLRPSNPNAEDLALRCLARVNDNWADATDPVNHPKIFESCEEALRLDHGNTRALSLLTYRLARSIVLGVDMTDELKRFDELTRKALAVDPNDGNARWAAGMLAFIHGRHDEAIVEFERAIEFNPSNISAYTWLSDLYFLTGQEEKAIAVVDKAIRSARSLSTCPICCCIRPWRLWFSDATRKRQVCWVRPWPCPRTTARFCGIRRPRSPISGATAKRAKSTVATPRLRERKWRPSLNIEPSLRL
jgi:tetratricopeptide (TPR) repeat protein